MVPGDGQGGRCTGCRRGSEHAFVPSFTPTGITSDRAGTLIGAQRVLGEVLLLPGRQAARPKDWRKDRSVERRPIVSRLHAAGDGL
jgi:hypothetical protein